MSILRLCGCALIHRCRERRGAAARKCCRSVLGCCGLRVCRVQCLLSLVCVIYKDPVESLQKFSYMEII